MTQQDENRNCMRGCPFSPISCPSVQRFPLTTTSTPPDLSTHPLLHTTVTSCLQLRDGAREGVASRWY